MSDQSKNYPRNKAYVDSPTNGQHASPKASWSKPSEQSPTGMSASMLVERVQDLEEQLIVLANSLNE